jgi:carbon-monoxide dehydrogenase medium subunit
VQRSDVVKRVIPALAALAGMIGDPAVRNRGTIGGSISNNDPAADYPSAVVGAWRDRRHHQARDRRRGILHRHVRNRARPGRDRDRGQIPEARAAAYQKFKNPASRYAIVGVFVAKTAGGVRVAVTGAGPCVFRVPEMEAALAKSFSPRRSRTSRSPDDGLNSDIHASAEYRAHLVNVMARRAVAACA